MFCENNERQAVIYKLVPCAGSERKGARKEESRARPRGSKLVLTFYVRVEQVGTL